MIIQAIPYRGFREKIEIVKDIKKHYKKPVIEIYSSYIYMETKGEK